MSSIGGWGSVVVDVVVGRGAVIVGGHGLVVVGWGIVVVIAVGERGVVVSVLLGGRRSS